MAPGRTSWKASPISRIPASVLAIVFALSAAPVPAVAADLNVMASGGVLSSLRALLPSFEAMTGDHVVLVSGPSMGVTPGAIPVRLARGDAGDVVILTSSALDQLAKDGLAVPGSKVDLSVSLIGMAVRQGAPVPDISTPDKLRQVLLNADLVAYSDSASGVYIQGEMFRKLGIAQEMLERAFMVPATPVGEVVARGEADLGFQQMSELLPVVGVTVVGPIPTEVQLVTTYSAGLATHATQPAEGRKFIEWLSTPQAATVLQKNGLQPSR